MDGYLIGLVFLAFAILALSIIQLQARHNRKLQRECHQLQLNLETWQDKLRDREGAIDQLERKFFQLLKWKDRAGELEEELRATKQTQDYASAKRLRHLEDYVASSQRNPATLFLRTFQPQGLHTFQDKLIAMLEGAEYEVVIVSPWIKRQTWDRVKGPLRRFARKGGKLRVFIRGCESDYTLGLSDKLQKEVEELGGEVVHVRQLHAKIYMVDRKEAIVTSANLTKGGLEGNYEAGIWLKDPAALKEICAFVEDLYNCRQS